MVKDLLVLLARPAMYPAMLAAGYGKVPLLAAEGDGPRWRWWKEQQRNAA
jgi:hypothetical protein